MNLELLTAALADQPPYRATQVWGWAARGASSYAEMTNVPAPLRAALEERVPFSSLRVVTETLAKDGTLKVLFHTHDGHAVEAVLMRFRDGRRSVCVSSQSGCPLTCGFCATGQMRFGRNLTASEILDQALHFRRIEPIDHARRHLPRRAGCRSRSVTPDEVDRLLGSVLTYADESFNTILELGFASSIRKEWEWRISRGEPTAQPRGVPRLAGAA